jgi:nitroreductase
MDLFEAIQRRHSYRSDYTDQQVSRDDLVKIVKAGLLAPSGKNCQTTRFIIVDDPDIIGKIKEMHPGNKAFQQAKAYILCVIDKDPEATYEGFSFQVEDCAAAVENMLLAITAMGYASVWIDGWLMVENRAEKIASLLGVPEDKIVRIILPVGVAAEEKSQPEKMPFEQRACINSWTL